MKTTENKGFGVIGVKVELSFVELLLIREQLGIIVESNLLDIPLLTPEQIALLNIVRFCEKMVNSNIGEAIERVGEELFFGLSVDSCAPAMPDEDVKDDCGAGDTQEEAH